VTAKEKSVLNRQSLIRWSTKFYVLAAVVSGSAAAPTAFAAQGDAKPQSPEEKEAAKLSKAGMAEHAAGRHVAAAALYHRAFNLDPAFVNYLYAAARAEQAAGMLTEAERDFAEFLAVAKEPNEKIREAGTHLAKVRQETALAAIRAESAAEERRQQMLDDAKKSEQARLLAISEERARWAADAREAQLNPSIGRGSTGTPGAWRAPTSTALFWLGALSAVAGIRVWSVASTDEGDLQARVAPGTKASLTYTDAQTEARRIDVQYRIGDGLFFSGAGIAIVGLLLKPSANTASLHLEPSANGLSIAGAW
jgi:tetratricopeptide (TPR) repeat protein